MLKEESLDERIKQDKPSLGDERTCAYCSDNHKTETCPFELEELCEMGGFKLIAKSIDDKLKKCRKEFEKERLEWVELCKQRMIDEHQKITEIIKQKIEVLDLKKKVHFKECEKTQHFDCFEVIRINANKESLQQLLVEIGDKK